MKLRKDAIEAQLAALEKEVRTRTERIAQRANAVAEAVLIAFGW